MRSRNPHAVVSETQGAGRFGGDHPSPRTSCSTFSVFRANNLYAAVLLLVALTTFLSNGCDLFTTRDPASPEDPAGSVDLALSANEAVTQLKQAILLRDSNLYLSVIADSFSYECTPQAYPAGPEFFNGWSFNQESNFVRNMLSLTLLPSDSTAELTLAREQQQEDADVAILLESYRLELHFVTEEVGTELPTVYEGLAELTIQRGLDSGWRIIHWRDEARGDSPTMSQLRASF
jgi:hypothetical protein